ncbi:LuxR C-terminal-related transcriptional regulator [Streptomyces sp. SYP-A7185]|uniref:LuxR C-terminal-related transcriptional regulator n=1 Tax=Streptomyces sp. SYP-A7185 TaxID=3040076 RepID=UPI0038F6D7AE
MAHWQQLLDELVAPGGSARGLEIAGDAWSGKTRRLDELARRAASSGWSVARGRPGRLQDSAPFGLFLDALDDLVTARGGELRARLGDEEQERLAALFPSMSQGVPHDHPSCDLYRECRAIRSLLRELAGGPDEAGGPHETSGPGEASGPHEADGPDQAGRPGEAGAPGGHGLLLILDDLHRADADSLDLLGYLLERPPTGPVLIAVAHRPRQLDHRTHTLLADAAARGFAHRVELVPYALDDPELTSLVPPGVDERTRLALLRRSGGNPGLLLALAATGTQAPFAVPPEPPARVAAALLDDFQGLGPSGRAMVGAAAVLGDSFDFAVAAAVAGLDEGDASAGLDEALAEDLVRPVGEGPDYCFRDAVVRAVAYHSAGRGWRSGAHARAAAALRCHRGPAELRAQQLLYAVEVADDEDVRALVDAAEDAAPRDPAAAVRWARHALRPAVTADAALRTRAQSVLGRALLHSGEFEEGAAVLQRLLAPGADLPAERRSEAVAAQALAHRLLGRPEAARHLLDDERPGTAACAGDCAADGEGVRPGCCTLRLARTALVLEAGGPWTGADRAALTALAAGAGAGGGVVQDPAPLAALAATEAQFGRMSLAAEHAERAAALVDALPDETLAAHLEAVQWLAGTELFLGLPRAAETHLERAVALARRFGQQHLAPRLLVGLGQARMRLGYFPEALACADEADHIARDTGATPMLALAAGLREELDLLHGVPGPVPQEPASLLPELSGREREISVLVSQGHTNQRIARSLELSPKTVETYLARIFKKLGVCSRAEVAAMVGRAAHLGSQEPVPTARPAA